MEFIWDFFTTTLFAFATVAALTSSVILLIPYMKFCCLRTKWRRMKYYQKQEGTLTHVMLTFATGLFVQSFFDTQFVHSEKWRWLITALALISSGIAGLLFCCIDNLLIYVLAGCGLYWMFNQTFPGLHGTWDQNLAYVVYLAAVIFIFVLLCAVKAWLRNILLDCIISAIGCAIVVYYVDYIQGAALDKFTGPGVDFIGTDQYPNQKMQHIIEMTVLYAFNRAGAIGAGIALMCYSKKPTDCAYKCRNSCCCHCCCESDEETAQVLHEREEERKKEGNHNTSEAIYFYDYRFNRGAESAWRPLPTRVPPEGSTALPIDRQLEGDGEDSDVEGQTNTQ